MVNLKNINRGKEIFKVVTKEINCIMKTIVMVIFIKKNTTTTIIIIKVQIINTNHTITIITIISLIMGLEIE